MQKTLKFGAITVVVLLGVLTVLRAVLGTPETPAQNSAQREGTPGPAVEVAGQVFDTLIIPGEGDHDTLATQVHFVSREEVFALKTEEVTKTLVDMCNAVVSRLDQLSLNRLKVDAINHVDLNVVAGGQKALLLDVSVFVRNGVCQEEFLFEPIDPEEEAFSKHTQNEMVGAFLHSWGVEQQNLKFTKSTSGNRIEVDYNLLSAFDRDAKSVNVLALCVATLAALKPETKVFVVTVAPANYPEMRIKVAKTRSAGGFSVTTGGGSASLPIENGRCLPKKVN